LVKETADALSRSGAQLMGVLLNDMKGVLPYYHRYRYSYQYYTPSAKA
jgi:hypothetical protein